MYLWVGEEGGWGGWRREGGKREGDRRRRVTSYDWLGGGGVAGQLPHTHTGRS
jgi:hypothetical protein